VTSPTPGSSSPAVCPPLPSTGPLASDTLIDAKLEQFPLGSRLVLTFGPKSGQPLNPTSELKAAQPPFYVGESGQTLQVAGDHTYQLRLDGQWISDASGQPTYAGDSDLKSATGTIREAVMNDASEGVISWILGTVGNGCVSMRSDTTAGQRLIVEVAGG